MTNKIFFLLAAMIFSLASQGQVGISADGSLPDPSAVLDVQFNNKGILLPRMTEDQMKSIPAPPDGSVVFCTSLGRFCVFVLRENAWRELAFGDPVPLPSVISIGTGGMCGNTTVSHALLVTGFPLYFNNTVEIELSVTVPGAYTISTNTLNGYKYSATGAFTYTGAQYVTLVGSGTPQTATTSQFTIASPNATGTCTFSTTAVTPGPCPALPTFTDPRNGKVYPTTQIGTQCWLKENLDIGTMIPGAQLPTPQDGTIQKYCYDDLASNCTTYGGLYTWDEVMGYQDSFIVEDFESGSGTTPPAGWVLEQVSGTEPGVTFVTASVNPTINSAFLGSRFVNYNSYNITGGSTRLKKVTPFSTMNHSEVKIEFAWHVDDGYPGFDDRVEVQWSTDGTNWTAAGSSSRYDILTGWKEESFVLPAGANNQPSVYIAFLFISAWGNNCSMDLVRVTGLRSICPDGWHVPGLSEIWTLVNNLQGKDVAGGMLKETGMAHWSNPNMGALNLMGFTALPGGIRNYTNGSFFWNMHFQVWIWSSTHENTPWPSGLQVLYNKRTADIGYKYDDFIGGSVRCLKD